MDLIKGTTLTWSGSGGATSRFENLPSAETLEVAMIEQFRSGDEPEAIRRWARDIAVRYGIWPYVQPQFNWRFNRAAAAASQEA